jgi:branched-chain amino acid transport system substrate-binding protein
VYLDSAEVAPIIDGYEECAEENGTEVVLSESVALGAGSMTDLALRIIDSEADVIFLEIADFMTAALWAELDLQGAQIPSLGNPGIYGDTLRDYAGPAAEGFVMQSGVLPPHSGEEAVVEVADIVEEYRPGTELIPVAMNAWVGAELFRLAAEAVLESGEELTRESLLAALDEVTDFDAGGLIPPISFGPDDHIGSPAYWFFELEDGQWGEVGELQEP